MSTYQYGSTARGHRAQTKRRFCLAAIFTGAGFAAMFALAACHITPILSDVEQRVAAQQQASQQTVATPTFTPSPNTYTSVPQVRISDSTAGVSIRYTTDGSDPSETVGTLYNDPLTISSTRTIRAIAFKDGMTSSAIASGEFIIEGSTNAFTMTGGLLGDYSVTFTVNEPGFTPSVQTSGEYPQWTGLSQGAQTTVTAASSPDATDYVWLLDGSQQSSTTASVDLPSGLSIGNHDLTLKLSNGSDPYRSATIILGVNLPFDPVAAPQFNLSAGAYTDPQTVTITTSTPGASIRYTIDGSTPTSADGTVCSGPVYIGGTSTLRAVAFKDGMTNSDETSATYTITGYAIGDTGPAGGIIFYDNPNWPADGWRFLEAAPSDQDGGSGIQWYNGTNIATGAAGTAIGTGKANTAAIVNAQGTGSYAAELCDSLSLGGFSDWFLPSKDELNEMYMQQQLIGGFAVSNDQYWTSSQFNLYGAWFQVFSGSGYQDYDGLDLTMRVRAIRQF